MIEFEGNSTIEDQIVFTESALLDLILNIEELSEYDIALTRTLDDNLILKIGESTYEVMPKQDYNMEVDSDVLVEIDNINEETYEDIVENSDEQIYQEDEDIESGFIAETLKTLAIGGVVRLGQKLLTS